MTRARYSVSNSRGGVQGRPYTVLDGTTRPGKIVEAHRSLVAAQASADRLNGRCTKCRRIGGHAPTCALAGFERDTEFGTEMEDDDA